MFITAMFRCCYLWSITFEPIFKKERGYIYFRLGHIFGTLCIYLSFVLTFILFKMVSWKQISPCLHFISFYSHGIPGRKSWRKEGRKGVLSSQFHGTVVGTSRRQKPEEDGHILSIGMMNARELALQKLCHMWFWIVSCWMLNQHSPFVHIWSEQHSFCTSHKIETDIPQGTGSMTKWI